MLEEYVKNKSSPYLNIPTANLPLRVNELMKKILPLVNSMRKFSQAADLLRQWDVAGKFKKNSRSLWFVKGTIN